MKKKILVALIVLCTLALVACGRTRDDKDSVKENEDLIVVGFSQVGAESDWRAANTESMKSAISEENGYKLIFDDAQQKQANQITAVRSFIQQEVDYIVIAPVTENGWETVLREAKDAGIPVIIVDRMVAVDESLFECWVGSDFELEAAKVCEWLNRFAIAEGINGSDIHIANIQGTIGASAQIGRSTGLRKAAEKNDWDLCGEFEGEFTKAKGYETTLEVIETHPEVNVIYCENDNEAFGAIEALESIGKTCGLDIMNGEIMVLSFDGVKTDALKYLMDGKISCIGECNPLHGPRVSAIIQSLEKGNSVDKLTYVDEEIFSTYEDTKTIFLDGEQYEMSLLDSDLLKEREKLFSIGAYTNETSDVY